MRPTHYLEQLSSDPFCEVRNIKSHRLHALNGNTDTKQIKTLHFRALYVQSTLTIYALKIFFQSQVHFSNFKNKFRHESGDKLSMQCTFV